MKLLRILSYIIFPEPFIRPSGKKNKSPVMSEAQQNARNSMYIEKFMREATKELGDEIRHNFFGKD